MDKVQKIGLSVLLSATIVAAAAIPTISYIVYQTQNKIDDGNPSDKPSGPSGDVQNKDAELVSLNVSLKEGVSYFANGKAKPKTDDFEVKANFESIVDGKKNDFSSDLSSDQFTISYDDDFKEKGGIIKIKYKNLTSDFEYQLVKVVPTKLELKGQPDKVYYKEGSKFEIDGLEVDSVNNDGSTSALDISKLSYDTNKTLTKDDTYVTLTYKEGDLNLPLEVNIKVVPEANYDEGTVQQVIVRGNPMVMAGDTFSNADFSKAKVLGVYTSGNKLALTKDADKGGFTVANGSMSSSFGDKAIIEVQSKDVLSIATSVKAFVYERGEAEDDHVGGEVKTENDVSYLTNFDANSSIYYSFKSKANVQTNLLVRVNNPKSGTDLGKVMNLTVNGTQVDIQGATIDSSVPADQFTLIQLAQVNLLASNNNITITFKSDADAEVLKALKVDFVLATTLNNLAQYKVLGDYMKDTERLGVDPQYSGNYLNVDKKEFSLGKLGCNNVNGAVSDGQYIYYAFADPDNKGFAVAQYDPESNSIIKTSDLVSIYKEKPNDWSQLFSILIKDDTIYVFNKKDPKWYGFDKGTLKANDKTISFEGLPDNFVISHVTYSQKEKKFIILSSGKVPYLADENGKVLTTKYESAKDGGFNKYMGVFTDDNYFYAAFSADGEPGLYVSAYDFNGKLVTSGLIEIDSSVLPEQKKINGRNLAFLNGKIYLGIGSWGSGSGLHLFEIGLSNSIFSSLDTNLFGDYLTYVKKNNVSPKISAKALQTAPEAGPWIDKEYFKMVDGAATDGTYGYYAFSTHGHLKAIVRKYDFKQNKFVGDSEVYNTNNTENNWSYETFNLFYLNGKIGLIDRVNQKIAYYSQDLKKQEEVKVSDAVTNLPSNTNVLGITYNSEVEKAAIMDVNGKVYWANDNLEIDGSKTPVQALKPKDDNKYRLQDISSDSKYFYVLSGKDAVAGGYIDMYSWDGMHQDPYMLEGLDPASTSKTFNLQNMITINDKVYFGLPDWNSGFVLNELNMKDPLVSYDGSLGQYVQDCEAKGVTPKYTMKASKDKFFKATYIGDQQLNYFESAFADGDDLYYVMETNGKQYSQIVKVDLLTKEVLASSELYDIGKGGQWSIEQFNLFTRGNNIGMIDLTNKKVRFYNKRTLKFVEEKDFSSTGKNIISLYSVTDDSYLMLDRSGNLSFVDNDFKPIDGKPTKQLNANGGNFVGMVVNGNEVYVTTNKDETNGFNSIILLDMNLNIVKDNIDLGVLPYPDGFTPSVNSTTKLPAINAQAMYFHNNKIYVAMLAYGQSSNYQVEITPDGEILDA